MKVTVLGISESRRDAQADCFCEMARADRSEQIVATGTGDDRQCDGITPLAVYYHVTDSSIQRRSAEDYQRREHDRDYGVRREQTKLRLTYNK